ncbi:MAG: T9SS type A sorting domain-containing protein, partial [Bacteroidia bacterium]|nr:T9SS type A sorting domain-containing protein [Bacteroidia bacterium]
LSYWYIITDANDSILTWVNANMMRDSALIDISVAPAGECHVWGWSYRGLSDPVVGDHISTLNDDPEEDISDNWITVIRETPDGGDVSLTNGGLTVSAAVGSDSLMFYVKNTGTASNLSYWYIITDADDNILTWVNANSMRDSALVDISGAPAGECHIWGWSYKGLDDPIVGDNISSLDDDVEEDISNNWVTVIRVGATNVEESFARSLKVYPNPARSILNIESEDIQIESVRILNLEGKLMIQSSQSRIDINELNRGIYLLQAVSRRGEVISRRFVKN